MKSTVSVGSMTLNVLAIPLAHAGLALATSLGAFFNATLPFKKLRRDHVYLPATGWRLFMLRILVDSLRGNLMTDRHEAAKLI
ncbi:MAG: lipid II flippase MurJ [Methylococcaceae bacterium]|nr:lipid II flippase MurJ [Methylococcaceae bacterium]